MIKGHTTVESVFRNFYNRIGNYDIFKSLATEEGTLVDTLELIVIRERYCGKVLTFCKSIEINENYAFGNCNFGKGACIKECTPTDCIKFDAIGKCHACKMRIFKRTKADVFNVGRNFKAPLSARRECNELGLILIVKHSISGRIVCIVFADNVVFKIFKTYECIFADISYIFGNIQSFDTCVIESIGINAKFFSATEGYRFEIYIISECGFTNSYNAIGNDNRLNIRACKG